MKPINIYALTRVTDADRVCRLERQMSGRRRFIKVKEWEQESLKSFCGQLLRTLPEAAGMRFFFSFTLPKLGKEFDLLRINADTVINIELKSKSVSDDAIKNQLLKNRYFLATLGRDMHFFTYVSSEDRLMRLSNAGRLVEGSWENLIELLTKQTDCYHGDIEDLFSENRYLISPLTDPGRFLRRDYVLTSQQWDIKKKITNNIKKRKKEPGDGILIQGFTGLPGTGKTILLYDLALELSAEQPVCLFHFGAHPRGLEELDRRLKRVDFYYCETDEPPEPERPCRAIFVDEGHRINDKTLKAICGCAEEWQAPVIISYDSEMPIAPEERKQNSTELLEAVPGFIRYQLTNRIRLNSELSSFIRTLVSISTGSRKKEYPNVSISYAKDETEASLLLRAYLHDGFIYVCDPLVDETDHDEDGIVFVSEATSREFDRVVMLLDDSFYYDEQGYLRSKDGSADGRVRHLFHGLNRAKQKIAVIVCGNLSVFDRLLGILQRV